MSEFKTYLSARNIPLVFIEAKSTFPILTVENYCKWYDVYLVQPDGKVEVVRDPEFAVNAWSDHVPRIKECLELADRLGAIWCENSLDMIVGRYQREIVNF